MQVHTEATHRFAILPEPLPAGLVLKQRFMIICVLKATALNTIYLAYDQSMDQLVVIKRLSTHPQPGGLPRVTVLRAWLYEAQFLRGLHYPHIPQLYAVFREAHDCFMAIEYVAGRTLTEVLAAGRLEAQQAYAIIDNLCAVVGHLHQQNPPIIHADIKPDNMLLTVDGQVVLIDFGIARQEGRTFVTREGIGSLPYASPEQCHGAILTRRSDIYGVGMVLKDLVGTSTNAAVQRIIEWATAHDPADRFPSIYLFQSALRQLNVRPLTPSPSWQRAA